MSTAILPQGDYMADTPDLDRICPTQATPFSKAYHEAKCWAERAEAVRQSGGQLWFDADGNVHIRREQPNVIH